MAIDLETFAAGDTDYIAKLNNDMATIETAINSLQTAIGGAAGSYSIPLFVDALFNSQTSLIGMDSYKPTISGTSLAVESGAAYKATIQAVVAGPYTVVPFAGQSAGLYYLVPDATGTVFRSDTPLDALYSVVWTGSSFGAITRVAKALYNVVEEDDGRRSLALGDESYDSLDARLEDAETTAGAAASAAQATADEALALAMELGADVEDLGSTRRVCLTIDGSGSAITTGIKGTIQVDFGGTIVGWSITGVNGETGDLTVEVSKKASTAPPGVPQVPDPTTDLISASAPMAISAASSASGGTSQVSTWTTTVAAWDVVQFNVTVAATLTKATIVLRVQQLG